MVTRLSILSQKATYCESKWLASSENYKISGGKYLREDEHMQKKQIENKKPFTQMNRFVKKKLKAMQLVLSHMKQLMVSRIEEKKRFQYWRMNVGELGNS